ncbi:MAG: hypothetical protein EOP85_05220, partial [Verrucomicrobiaceae bacterium]
LILNGGNIDQAGGGTSTTMVLTGTVLSKAPAFVGSLGTTTTNCETLDFAAPISGESVINIGGTGNGGANRGVVRMSAANPFTGTVNAIQPTGGAIAHATNRLFQLAHVDALQYATLNILISEDNGISFAATANTGTFRVGGLNSSSQAPLALQDTAGAAITLDVGSNNLNSEIYGPLTGPGNLIKSGDGIFYLFAQNTYTGNTTVNKGVLSIDLPVLADTATLSIASTGFLELFHSEEDVVGSLVLAGEVKGPGVYDSTNSGGLILGSGKIRVLGAPTGGFTSYMDTFPSLSSGDKTANADPDKDGITNLVEYALSGLNPTSPDTLGATLSSGSLTFNKRAEAVTNNDINYIIETSVNLGGAPGDWTTVVPTANDPTTISYTLPAGQPKIFARLKITQK